MPPAGVAAAALPLTGVAALVVRAVVGLAGGGRSSSDEAAEPALVADGAEVPATWDSFCLVLPRLKKDEVLRTVTAAGGDGGRGAAGGGSSSDMALEEAAVQQTRCGRKPALEPANFSKSQSEGGEQAHIWVLNQCHAGSPRRLRQSNDLKYVKGI